MMTGVAPGCDRVLQRRWCCKFQGREQSAGTWVFHVVWHILMQTQTLSTFGARLTEWAGSEIGRWFSARQFLRSLLSRQGLGKDKHKHFFKLMQPAQTSKIFQDHKLHTQRHNGVCWISVLGKRGLTTRSLGITSFTSVETLDPAEDSVLMPRRTQRSVSNSMHVVKAKL
jgi:hypothetical protein